MEFYILCFGQLRLFAPSVLHVTSIRIVIFDNKLTRGSHGKPPYTGIVTQYMPSIIPARATSRCVA